MKFSIRDLLWLIVAVAVLMAWVVDRQNLQKENRRIQTQSALEALDQAMRNQELERQLEMLREQQEQIYSGMPNPQAPASNPPEK